LRERHPTVIVRPYQPLAMLVMSESAISGPVAAVPVVYTRRRLRPALTGYALLLPSALFLIAFTYWPVLKVVQTSFTVTGFRQAAHWGLDNYAHLFADPHFAAAVTNNILYAAGTIIPSLLIALGLALALQETTALSSILRTLVALPMLIPLVAAAALFAFILLPSAGLLDTALARFGLAETNWLGDPSLALGSIIAITIWKNCGYYMLFFLAGLAGVPSDLLDAARLDGAGALQRLHHITLPLLMPTIAFVLIIASLNALTQVDHVIVLTQGGPSDATSMLLFYIYQQAHQNFDIGRASAATVVSVAVLFALSMLSLRNLERGIHYEG
jgi:sn-glycerol 3-phosphate transport system permease protein